MTGLVSVKESRQLLATVYACKAAPAELRKQLRAHTRTVAGAEWGSALAHRPATVPQSRVLVATSRVKASDSQVTLTSGTSKRKVASGGLRPYDTAKAMEFGAGRGRQKTYPSRRGTARFNVTRHTTRQILPVRRTGYVVYPAFAYFAPRILALWVQTTVRTIAEALEGKR